MTIGRYDGDTSGIVFHGVAVPQGATIATATVTLEAMSSTSGTIYLDIYGEDADNTDDFDDESDYDARQANKTSAKVDWDEDTAWTANTQYTSLDIKTIIQEIVNRESWSSGNNITLFLNVDDARFPHTGLHGDPGRSSKGIVTKT